MYIGVNDKSKTINQIFAGVNGVAKLIYTKAVAPEPPKFELPTFTGSHTVFGDANSGRIEIYESGTLVLSPATYDLFAVGGGGKGGSDVGGGGGGGYTETQTGYIVENSKSFQVTVGAGSSSTKIIDPKLVSIIEALPGKNGAKRAGGNGGSGGGGTGSGGGGGSNGGNGGRGNPSGSIGGSGQGTTTKSFGESNGTLYAGGGGGSSGSSNNTNYGGAGGGGNGIYARPTATGGTPNTGGGGGGNGGDYSGKEGGSGIVIIRWNNT